MILLRGSHSQPSPQRGSTLLLSLLATIVVVSLSAVFLQLTSSVAKRQSQASDQKRSFYLAEAGLAESFAAIRCGKSGTIGSETKPALYGNGLFWVTTTDLGGGLISLESTGMCGTTLTKLDLVVSEGSPSVAALGVFSNSDLTISSGSTLSYFDSDPGGGGGGAPFGGAGPQELGGGGALSTTYEEDGRLTLYKDEGTEGVARVSTNGNIVISESFGETTQVLGDLRPGISGTLSKVGAPEITGSVAPLAAPVKLPAVEVPSFTQRPGYNHAAVQPFVVAPLVGSYKFLTVGSSSELTITGPSVLVLEKLEVDNGAKVTFDTLSGPIQIYVTEKLNLKSGSTIEVTSGSALDLNIQVSNNADVNLKSASDFYGTLYAPAAKVIVDEDFHVFGSLVANELKLDGPCQLSFDEALGRAALADALPVLVSWRIVDLDPNASPSGDPFLELGVVKSTLDAPSLSHEDQQLVISYMDSAGVQQNYDGLESGFAWNSVGQVLNMTRDGKITGSIEGLAGIGGTGDGTGLVRTSTKSDPTPTRTFLLNSL